MDDALKIVTREALFYPGIEDQKAVYVSVSEIVGTVAMWAIQQSPYAVPDNLEVVCKKLDELLVASPAVKLLANDDTRIFKIDFSNWSAVRAVETLVRNKLHEIPEYLAWNERKNGNQTPFGFTSAYDGKRNPDDDFIDLGALERNVAMSIVQRYIIDSRDGWPMGQDGPVKVDQGPAN